MRVRMLLVFCAAAVCALAADFTGSLTREEMEKLGLDKLSPEQRAALDAAVERYKQTGETAAAAAAVETYKKTEQPKVVTQALAEEKEERESSLRVESRIKGKFRGWFGGTVFQLENGQIWKQVGSDTYAAAAMESPEVEIAKSRYGHYRLRLADGAWVNVKRLQ